MPMAKNSRSLYEWRIRCFIEEVEGPTDWVNSMVMIIKPNGKLQICIDPHDLNKAIKREYYPMRTIDKIITRMPNATVFSVNSEF